VDLQQRTAAVGNGNIDVGNQIPIREPGRPIVERTVQDSGSSELQIDPSIPLKTARPAVCGAMSQQSGDSGRGTESAPQKFIRLVGYRDPKAPHEPWVRPHPAPVKR
jgi:hypothetical protein